MGNGSEIADLARFPSENPNPVLRIARDGTVLYSNRPSVRLLDAWGVSPDGKLAGAPYQFVTAALDSGESQYAEIPCGDRVLSLTFAPVADTDYVNVYALDVTDRVRAERDRKELIRELEAKNAELERFTYAVSHDLKSPLITVQGFAGQLAQDIALGDTKRLDDDIGRIIGATAKMQRLLDELLALSCIGRVMKPPENVALADVAGETVQMLAGVIDGRGVVVDVSSDLPVVLGDRIRLREVLQNLVENAVKFMGDQPEPRVEIGTRKDDRDTVCYVRDNGTGVNPRYQPRVFGLFDQLDQGVEGAGVGLAIVKRVVEVHGGRVWVESEGEGRGSTFCFVIPEGVEGGKNER